MLVGWSVDSRDSELVGCLVGCVVFGWLANLVVGQLVCSGLVCWLIWFFDISYISYITYMLVASCPDL